MAFCYDFPRPSVTVDCIVLRILNEDLEILLIKRKKDPYKDCWALPGGFMEIDETPEQAVVREVEEETGVKVEGLMQIGAFGAVNRDPRGRTVSIAYLSFLNGNQKVKAASDAAEVKWLSVKDSLALAFDHDLILSTTLKLLSAGEMVEAIKSDLVLDRLAAEKLVHSASQLVR